MTNNEIKNDIQHQAFDKNKMLLDLPYGGLYGNNSNSWPNTPNRISSEKKD